MEESLDSMAADRLAMLQEQVACMADVCSSGGIVAGFPERMREGFVCFGIGLVVGHAGRFGFTLSGREHTARAAQTGFIPDGAYFKADGQAPGLAVSIIIYKTAPIRYVLGTMVQTVKHYSLMSPERPCVWTTVDEDGRAG